MSSFIEYEDKKLEKKIKEKFGNSYGDFQPILVDILLKRKFVFGFSDEHIIREAEKILNNTSLIQYSEDSSVPNCNGAHCNQSRMLVIMANSNVENLYKIVVHEIFHALSSRIIDSNENEFDISLPNVEKKEIEQKYTSDYETGIYKMREPRKGEPRYIGELYKQDGVFSNETMEAFNERTANLFYNGGFFGYLNITFFPHLLSAVLGLCERDMLKAGNDSSRVFLKKIYSLFPENQKNTIDQCIEKMGKQVDTIYIAKAMAECVGYRHKGKKELNASIEGVNNVAYELFELQVKNDKRELSDELIGELVCRYNGIDKSIIDAENTNEPYVNKKCKQKVEARKKESFRMVRDFFMLNKLKDLVSDKEKLAQYQILLKTGNIEELSKQILDDNPNVNIQSIYDSFDDYIEKKEYENCKYYQDIKEKDFFNGKIWDNTKVNEMLMDLLRKSEINKSQKKSSEIITLPDIKDIMSDNTISARKYAELEELNNKFKFYKTYCSYHIKTILSSYSMVYASKNYSNETMYMLKKYHDELLKFAESKQYQDRQGINTGKIFDTVNGIQKSKVKMEKVINGIFKRGIFTEQQVNDLMQDLEKKDNILINRMYNLYGQQKFYEKNGYIPERYAQDDSADYMGYYNAEEFEKEQKKYNSFINSIMRKLNLHKNKKNHKNIELPEGMHVDTISDNRKKYIESLRAPHQNSEELVQRNEQVYNIEKKNNREQDTDINR